MRKANAAETDRRQGTDNLESTKQGRSDCFLVYIMGHRLLLIYFLICKNGGVNVLHKYLKKKYILNIKVRIYDSSIF